MGRCDKVDIMTPHSLEMQHHASKSFGNYFIAFFLMADIPVLTENTEEIAIGHKDGSRTMLAYKGVLFAEMGIEA